jgi:thioredoxin-related protein
MLFGETAAVYCEKSKKHINCVEEIQIILHTEAPGTYKFQHDLKGYFWHVALL